ncbi:MAG: PQQ-binding-like beta-propeller repeat protein, partial [Planctomycetia bacterium]
TDGADGGTVALRLDFKTGQEVWRKEIDSNYENKWGDGPRCTPTIDGDQLYLLTGLGTLACLQTVDGAVVWKKSLTEDFRGKVNSWGYCESPLVDGDVVVATPGGKNTMIALDKRTGETFWTSTGVNAVAHYSSPIKVVFDGVPMYVNLTAGGLLGVDAKTGKFLWNYDKTANKTASIPTPIYSDGFVYSTSGYGTGCGLVKLARSGEGVTAEEVYFKKDMKNHHGGVLLHEGHIYGYSDGAGWMCQKFDTGEVVWTEKKKHGKGSVTFADGKLYCYDEASGVVKLVDATPESWSETGGLKLPEQTTYERKSGKIWTHPVVVGGRLLLRDQDLIFCFDVSGK